MKKLYLNFVVVVALLVSLVAIPSRVSATSMYDDFWQNTSDTTFVNTTYSQCDGYDITDKWESTVLNSQWGSTFSAVTQASNGNWGLTNAIARYERSSSPAVYGNAFEVYYGYDLSLNWTSYTGYKWVTVNNVSQSLEITVSWDSTTSSCQLSVQNMFGAFAIPSVAIGGSLASDPTYPGYASVYYNGDANLPLNYAGANVPSDVDRDGLVASKEALQLTSDTNPDTDGDGISDYIESDSYPLRNSVFCGSQCAYPDPTKKDIFVEVDWMKDENNRSFAPSSTQLTSVASAFSSEDINAHFDTGQYGGGNEVSEYVDILPFSRESSSLDYYDIKNGSSSVASNFNPIRKGIWRYALFGKQYTDGDSSDSSGGTLAGDDDTFISKGLIEDSQSAYNYSSLNTAISGTILHELGHGLCLTPTSVTNYSFQPSSCIYSGIDSNSSTLSYISSMNYIYQMQMVDFSSGLNGNTYDHDDWSAIALGIRDFSNSTRNEGDSDPENGVSKSKSQKKKISKGLTISQAKMLKAKGLLKPINGSKR